MQEELKVGESSYIIGRMHYFPYLISLCFETIVWTVSQEYFKSCMRWFKKSILKEFFLLFYENNFDFKIFNFS